jgi:hypothetical protein
MYKNNEASSLCYRKPTVHIPIGKDIFCTPCRLCPLEVELQRPEMMEISTIPLLGCSTLYYLLIITMLLRRESKHTIPDTKLQIFSSTFYVESSRISSIR